MLADRAAAGHLAGFDRFTALLGRRWWSTHPGFCAAVTGINAAPFNGVMVSGPCDRAELTEVLDRIRAEDMPFMVQARPAVADEVDDVLARIGLKRIADRPMMVATELRQPPPVSRLTVRRLGPDEAEVHAVIMAEAFLAPPELVNLALPPAVMSDPNRHLLVGELDGEAVTTAIADVTGESVGIFNVGTLESHRGQGLGAAITAAAVQAGFSAGAAFALLLSSPMGLGVYERLGFRAVETWSAWEPFPEL